MAGLKSVSLGGGPPSLPLVRQQYSRSEAACLHEAAVLMVLDLVSDAVLVAAGRVKTWRSSEDESNPPWDPGPKASGADAGAAGPGRHFVGILGCGPRSRGQDGHMTPYPQTCFLRPWQTPPEGAGFLSTQLTTEITLHPPFLLMEPPSQEGLLSHA